MSGRQPRIHQELLYEADEQPPLLATLGLGLMIAALSVPSIILVPTILISSADGTESYLGWAVFAALVVSGTTTIIQSMRLGRLGAGYIVVMGSTGAFLAISVTALERGGPGLLAALVLVSSMAQFVLGSRMAALRRVFTPIVAGTVLMLMPVTIAPIMFELLTDVPQSAATAAAPVTAFVTLVAMVLVALRFSGYWRLWAMAIGMVGGTLTGAAFGLYDLDRIAEAPWFSLPDFSGYPGIDWSFSISFWTLLPGFLIVTLVGAMETLGKSIAIQRASWRKPRAIDFRSIQGAINADGLGNLLSGIGGTVPNSTYGDSIAVAELTGVAARIVGACVGALFICVAFLPKMIALIVAIPGPVAGAFLIVVVAMLFVFGVKILLNDGLDYRKSLIVGIAFWAGLSFQFDMIYPEILQGPLGDVLGNGMTTGGIVVMLLSGFLDLTRSSPRRIRTSLSTASLPEIDAFLCDFAKRMQFDEWNTTRMRATGEEILHVLLGNGSENSGRELLLVARPDGSAADLEFIAGGSDLNLEDQLALLSEGVTDIPNESEAPLRLLRHYATSVRHKQYHGTDIAAVRLEPQGAA